MTDKLSKEDVLKLAADKSAENREATAEKLAGQLAQGGLSGDERRLLEDIVKLMVKDVEVRVRQTLSRNLQDFKDLPHDIAMDLAKDVESVSAPLLEVSAVFSDEDLIELVQLGDPSKQTAIAKRENIGEGVSDALIDHGNEHVVSTLMSNETAKIAESSFNKALDKYGDSDLVKEAMTYRSNVPLVVSERLVTMVTDKLKERIMTHHQLSADTATDLILQTREKTVLGLITAETEFEDVEALIAELDKNGRLTPSIVMRALMMGDISFFMAAISHRSGMTLNEAYTFLEENGLEGLNTLCAKAGMPAVLVPAVRVAFSVAAELDYDGGDYDRERYAQTMLERILTQYEAMGRNDLEYLMSKLSVLQKTHGTKEFADAS